MKRNSPSRGGKAITVKRAARLLRLIRLLGTGPKSRPAILRRLHVDIRTFYRDLVFLRDCRIAVGFEGGRYSLELKPQAAIDQLPLPDPGLTLGEARLLAKGRTQAHAKLRKLLQSIEG